MLHLVFCTFLFALILVITPCSVYSTSSFLKTVRYSIVLTGHHPSNFYWTFRFPYKYGIPCVSAGPMAVNIFNVLDIAKLLPTEAVSVYVSVPASSASLPVPHHQCCHIF